ncbi:MAG: hypothetical protein IT548_19050 [Alphaproteobacteria bacterium]|nr:hypothetical protein [Alphaproteobacteria bacterium]
MTDRISTIAALEGVVGTAPLGVKMKIIDHVDRGAADWIARSPIGFIAFASPDGPRACLAGGKGGLRRDAQPVPALPACRRPG